MQYHNRKALTGLLTAVSIALAVFENFFALPIPGVRLGLANIGIMLSIYLIDFKAVLFIAFMKGLLVPVITGNFIVKLSIGMPATVGSAVAMYIYYKLSNRVTTPYSVGALGGFVHMLLQLAIVKLFYVKSVGIYFLIPWFASISIMTGVLTGYVTFILVRFHNNRR